jgi:hypothetical protein
MNGEPKEIVGGPHLNACRPKGETAISYVVDTGIKTREIIYRPQNEAVLRGFDHSEICGRNAHKIAPIMEVA